MLFISLFGLHTVFASPVPALQSDQVVIDDFINNLEKAPTSRGTWDILTANISHTFGGQNKLYTSLISTSTLTESSLYNLPLRQLTIYQHYIPETHDALRQITDDRVAVVGPIKQQTLEQCTSGLGNGRLYLIGEYNITQALLRCTGSVGLYLNTVNHIEIPLDKNTFKNLRTLSVHGDLDMDSIQNLLGYTQHLTVLGTKVPSWLLQNIEQLQAYSLNLPEVHQLSQVETAQLSKFKGEILKLNNLESLSKREAQAFQSFSNTLELKGLNHLKANIFTALLQGPSRLEVQISELTPAHFKTTIANTTVFHGLQQIPLQTAKALQSLNGTLIFPDLQSLSPQSYLYLLWGSKESITQENIPEWKRKTRRIIIPFDKVEMTTEWVQIILFLQNHFWKTSQTDLNLLVKERLRWLGEFGSYTADGLRLMLQNILPTKGITNLNGLHHITPEIAEILIEQTSKNSSASLELNGLQEIDDKSFTILVNGKYHLSLNGLETLRPSQVDILMKRPHLNRITLQGLTVIEPSVFTDLVPIEEVVLPSWLKVQPEYLQKHLNRLPSAHQDIDFQDIPLSLFEEIDFSQQKTLNLQTLKVLTPTHVKHIAKYSWEDISIPAHLLTPDNIVALQQWSDPNTRFNIEVQDVPIERLRGIEDIPINRLSLGNITTDNPDLGFLFTGDIPNLEIESPLPIHGVSDFSGESLTISRYKDWDNNRYNHKDVNELILAFEGQQLTVGFIDALTPSLAQTIMSRQFHLRIHSDNLMEDQENVILDILQQKELRDMNYQLYIEGLDVICPQALDGSFSFSHINASELCIQAQEMLESLDYWENHDCGEHDTGDH